MAVIKGKGFNSRGGGFTVIEIDGKNYPAAMVAALPDLLAAAKMLIEWDEGDLPDDDNLELYDWEAKQLTALVDATRAAVAKAERRP